MNRCGSRLIVTLSMVVALSNLAAPGRPARAQESDDYVSDEVVVKLHQSTDLAGVASDYALHPTPLDQLGARAIYRMRIVDGGAPPDRAAALAADSRVVYAEPNYLGQAPEAQQQVSWAKGGDGDAYAGQWAVSLIKLPEAHNFTRGTGVTLAVLDTGVDFLHPALAGRLVNGYDFVDRDGDPSEVGDPDQNVAYGHGTHVAGLIALAAPEARIMPVRVLDPDGGSNVWVIAEALAYAVNPDGDRDTADGADVINLSLSTPRRTDLLAEIVAAIECDGGGECLAGQRGVVVVAAAGNDGSTTPEYPAAEGVDGLLAVGASTAADALASFSNRGPWVHVAAPGENVLSSVPGGEYGVWSGTSTATPLAAGVAALVRAAYPGLDAPDVVAQMISSAANIGGPVSGRIDSAAALGLPIGGELVCTGTLGTVTVDNLLVPPGQTCTLVGAQVQGTLKVEGGATLNAARVSVAGSVQAKGAASVSIDDSTISGSVQIEESGSARLDASSVNGDVQFFKNTASLTITNNTIGGNLQCKENVLTPTGGGNAVQGNREDQCAGL
jgi:subtilisin family serine protease